MGTKPRTPHDSTEGVDALDRDPALLPVALDQTTHDAEEAHWTPAKIALWGGISLLGGLSWVMLAVVRGETVNAIWFVFAAVCTYLIGYRFYSNYIQKHLTRPDDRRATPAEYKADGKDYAATDRRVLFGHHFAAIAGAGPLVGPVLAAQMGYLPGTIWIIVGVVLAGAVQDYLVLFFSMRRGGRSLGQMARDELGKVGGTAALIATLAIMVIIVAILALVVVNALAASPWGVFSVSMTIPIALFMGVYLRFFRPGRVSEISIIGFILLLAAIVGGGMIADTEWGASFFHVDPLPLAIGIIIYGFVAAILPVWLLLAPRDYLSTFMKIGTIGMLALAIIIVRPEIAAPATSEFVNGGGPVVSGSLFPFLFVTIACGALSGFHALIASGTTPKLIEKERQTRFIGYGGMLMESFVAIMALVAALSIDRGIYFAMNSSAALTGGTVEGAVAFVNGLGLTGVNLTPDMLTETAKNVGESTIVSRSGGAPTLSVGLANIMHQVIGGQGMMAFWYHFAIMFEALFILTAVDAGTRVARFMLQDSLGNFFPKFKNTSWRAGAWLTTGIMVAAWGAVLIMGVTDPLGGINTLFPLFGIANQLLAAIALAVCLAIVAKRGLFKYLWIVALPLTFAAVVTIYASFLKIFSTVPAVGYFAQNRAFSKALDDGLTTFGTAKTVEAMEAVVRNTMVQGILSILFVVLAIIVMITAVQATWKSYKTRDFGTNEDDAVPSQMFAPSGFGATPAEKALSSLWDAQTAQAKVAKVGTPERTTRR
ncbi:carbon starvation protein A [Cryobacterium sp. TMT1-21]|uniref:Carbon starvation protein A n=1 Tax=Cryobacterium shii TaxID=1259235 RepID=A0AAQ2HDV9_9MICO|nr:MULTISPECIES: carbon starvation CstA family protein [Cryobacterium]TFC41153.1 carbon starvation protein A [Cryobacterium shii]TFC87608.1 carbon starvation protein A [Cryobacterium sp. TmT2-59]TFD07358.1 carbon starvation protein A [Cryobacterium sp. TMT1-21]TFD16450.1 carbon starvation protein A [Cryobacterium sp. TMT4-10]TFD38568.1 carbon starvation protein A [Cryobacterium sp. TMT2-10]